MPGSSSVLRDAAVISLVTIASFVMWNIYYGSRDEDEKDDAALLGISIAVVWCILLSCYFVLFFTPL